MPLAERGGSQETTAVVAVIEETVIFCGGELGTSREPEPEPSSDSAGHSSSAREKKKRKTVIISSSATA